MVCNRCGSQNKIEDKYCKNCKALLQETPSEFKKQANIKTKPIMIIAAVIIVLIVLFIGREGPLLIKQMKSNTVTIGNYNMKVSGIYETSVKNNVLILTSNQFGSKEMVGVQIYPDSYDNVVFNFRQLQNAGEMIIYVKQTEYEERDWLIASYQMKNYRGAVAITKASGDEIFWIQAITTTHKRGKKLVEDIIPFVNDATKLETDTKQKSTTSASIVSKLIEMTE